MSDSGKNTCQTEWEELNAVLHIMKELRRRNKFIYSQDLHSLLVKAPTVKTFLQSKWKLSELGDFVKKYPQHFKVEKDEAVFLRKPDVKAEELECIAFFFDLLLKRGNRPIHVLSAGCFVSSSSINEFLKLSYSSSDLTGFFNSHRDFFETNNGLISLKEAVQSTKPAPAAKQKESSTPVTNLSKEEMHYNAAMDKIARDFYVDLVAKRQEVSVSQAHSFLQGDVQLRDYLKKNYTIANLTSFFQKYPGNFLLRNEHVYPRVTAKKSENSNSSGVTKNPAQGSTNPVVPTNPPITANEDQTKSKVPPVSSENVKNGKLKTKDLPNLFSLLKTNSFSSQPSVKKVENGFTVKSKDVACQTISSGPILSLSIFEETKNGS